MPTVIKPKYSVTPGAAPLVGDLAEAEIAINAADGRLYVRDDTSTVVEVGLKPSGAIDINSGTIDGTTIGATTPSTVSATDVTATGTVNLTGATVSNLGSVTTADINGGTIDATTIGATTPAAGNFSTVDIDGGTIDGAVIGGSSKAAIDGTTIKATTAVGIGAAITPSRTLEVEGVISATNSADTTAMLFSPTATENTIISRAGDASATALPLVFMGGAAERMRIDTDGSVGVGVTSPAYDLHVQGEVGINSVDNTTGYGKLLFRNTDNSSGFAQIRAQIGDNIFRYQVNSGVTQEWGASSSTYMSIDSSGLVNGVWSDNGVSNPDAKIRVLTQAQYDGLTPDADTLYFIVG